MSHKQGRDVEGIVSLADVEVGVTVPEHVGPSDVGLSEASRRHTAAVTFSFYQDVALELVGESFFEASFVEGVLNVEEGVLLLKDAVSVRVADKAVPLSSLALSPLEDGSGFLFDLFLAEGIFALGARSVDEGAHADVRALAVVLAARNVAGSGLLGQATPEGGEQVRETYHMLIIDNLRNSSSDAINICFS